MNKENKYRMAIKENKYRMAIKENKYRMTIKQYIEENGYEDLEDWKEFLEEIIVSSVAPALCTEGCEVELDGTCPHGCPSIILAAGMI